jgi:hypothetical protein
MQRYERKILQKDQLHQNQQIQGVSQQPQLSLQS